MKRLLVLILAICFMQGCSKPVEVIYVGVDGAWYPHDFGQQTPYVNGFVADLLIEITKEGPFHLRKIAAGNDDLLAGLKTGGYDAILSSLPPYTFNCANYSFSSNFLKLGPVLIVAEDAEHTKLENFEYEAIGIIEGDSSAEAIRSYPKIIIKKFSGPVALLNAVVTQEIAGALLDQIPAVNYVTDVYQGSLKIIGEPLTDEGLHFVFNKGANANVCLFFNRRIQELQSDGTLAKLLQKWNLASL